MPQDIPALHSSHTNTLTSTDLPTTPKSEQSDKPDPRPPSPSLVAPTTTPTPPLTSVEKPDDATQPELEKSEPEDTLSTEGIVDMETFQQIIELDEDDDHEFSRGMAWAYFGQAEQTFKEMDEALAAKDLPNLSSLGHFLKGSSAALGLSKVQASCEKIQHYGQKLDEESGKSLSDEEALTRIRAVRSQVSKEYAAAEKWLKGWYDKEEADAAGGGSDDS